MDLAHDRDGRPVTRRLERSALTGETSADDEDVVCRHGGGAYLSGEF
jgi:hypothetical protein